MEAAAQFSRRELIHELGRIPKLLVVVGFSIFFFFFVLHYALDGQERLLAGLSSSLASLSGFSTAGNRTIVGCDLSDGSWVYDHDAREGLPLYRSRDCPFIDEAFRCLENGRPDDKFTRWRWQPSRCDLPRFDAERAVEQMGGRRMAFVGDSMGRNQWESMMCMLASGIRNASDRERIYEENGEPITKHKGHLAFRFPGYGKNEKKLSIVVEYYRSPYLVPRGAPPSPSPPNVSCTVRVDVPDWSSRDWADADVLVFNSGHWWTFSKLMREGCYFQVGDHVNVTMGIEEGFKRALATWRDWVASRLGTGKTRVFFTTYSPTHFSGGLWNTGGRCSKETQPLPAGAKFEEHWTKEHIVVAVEQLRDLGAQVLDITRMSSYRKDAHCSIYTGKEPRRMSNQDCSHWCLPGLPDAWNELLLATLFSPVSSS